MNDIDGAHTTHPAIVSSPCSCRFAHFELRLSLTHLPMSTPSSSSTSSRSGRAYSHRGPFSHTSLFESPSRGGLLCAIAHELVAGALLATNRSWRRDATTTFVRREASRRTQTNQSRSLSLIRRIANNMLRSRYRHPYSLLLVSYLYHPDSSKLPR
jgi:hypothetical protein